MTANQSRAKALELMGKPNEGDLLDLPNDTEGLSYPLARTTKKTRKLRRARKRGV